MIRGLHLYPDYKNSGAPWLGQIPAHWDIQRNGRLFAQRNETGFGNLPILEVSLRTGVRVRDMHDGKRKQMMADREKYKRAVEGDIAYNMMRMWQGAVGVVPTDGLVSPAYVVARPHPGTETRYFAYLFRTDIYKSEIDAFSRGIVKDRNRLYWEDFKRMATCVPPVTEQRAISDFLDDNAAKVRRFILNRRRRIDLLNEQKQAIIDEIATCGANFPMRRLRTVAELRVSNVDKHTKSGEFPVRLCNYTDVYRNSTITADMPFMTATATAGEIHAFHVEIGDVIITKDSEEWQDIGVPSLVTQTADDLVCGYHLAILRPRTAKITGDFLTYALRSRGVVTQFSIAANGVTRYGLSHGAIKAIQLPIPKLDEQISIVQRINKATASLNASISRSVREINLIQEYRTRLVADVVTGKIDVRGFTTTEPAPPNEPMDDVMNAEGLEDDEAELGEDAPNE